MQKEEMCHKRQVWKSFQVTRTVNSGRYGRKVRLDLTVRRFSVTWGSKFLVVCYSRIMNELIMPWIKSIKALKQDRQKVQSFGILDCEDMERKRYRRSRMIYWKELEHFDVWKDISWLRKEFKCNRWAAKLRRRLQLARWSKGRYLDKAYSRENEVKGSELCLRIELYNKMAVLWQLYTVFQNYCRVNSFIYCKFRRKKLIFILDHFLF